MKQSIKKTNLLVALFTTTLLSTAATAAVPKTALIKAEPIKQTSLTTAAHSNLKLSLSPVNIDFVQPENTESLVKQKQAANKNKTVNLTKATLIAE